mmetsp:Transcript_67504/g.162009  ORF Transcript_67504/g.162009 Transcript_67504/m.162009 type:complete len:1395 (+) Transcript_67504:62-4246(+)|eukprot:CAMPEP_0178392320 /NCGR_PEP_ID=MMETSP0689_2-20121128/11619_1 /TAXON_ID=160604 /ORGANISM="Amphidinium massartii, Strain CS-259" /LENGTH=1394 /DNA_ID=CAMNT_0020012893 /DNA_START=56 /DNA_END=4240 /DNA_ORIENTATION=-
MAAAERAAPVVARPAEDSAASQALRLIERAFEAALPRDLGSDAEGDIGAIGEIRVTRRAKWPRHVEAAFTSALHRASCGLAGANLVWVSVDGMIYLWDASCEDAEVVAVPADSAVITASVGPPRPGVFQQGHSPDFHLLVIASRLSVTIVGLAVLGSGSQSARYRLHTIALDGYTAPTHGAIFHRICHCQDGRIFLLCGAPQVYELAYSTEAGWFHAKCRLVRHNLGSIAKELLPFWQVPAGRVRLFASCSAHLAISIDDVGTFRLLRVLDAASGGESLSSFKELACMPLQKLKEQVLSRGFAATVRSWTFAHIFPFVSCDGQLMLTAATAAGERFIFACHDAHSVQNPGFTLLRVIPAKWSTDTIRESSWLPQDVPLLMENFDPCLFESGAWVNIHRGVDSAALELRVAVDSGDNGSGIPGLSSFASGNAALRLDTCPLDIASALKPPLHRQGTTLPMGGFGEWTFAALLPGSLVVFDFVHLARPITSPPSNSAECFWFFMQLGLPSASIASQQSSPSQDDAVASSAWRWHLDDVQIPAFKEQCRMAQMACQLPPAYLGRWCQGLLAFLGVVLRPLWHTCFLQEVKAHHFYSVFAKRRRTSVKYCVGMTAGLVQQALLRLKPVVTFLRQRAPNRNETSVQEVPGSAAARSMLLQRLQNPKLFLRQSVVDLVSELVEVIDRSVQVLALVNILEVSGLQHQVLQSPLLSEQALTVLASSTLASLVSSGSSLWPTVELCTALIGESSAAAFATEQLLLPNEDGPLWHTASTAEQPADANTAKSLADAVCRALLKGCPDIYARVDLLRCMPGAPEATRTFTASADGSVPVPAEQSHWEGLARSVQVTAERDAAAAGQIVLESASQLSSGEEQVSMRISRLVDALLAGVGQNSNRSSCSAALEELLRQLGESEEAVNCECHETVLDGLLRTSSLSWLLEALLPCTSISLEHFLCQRSNTSRVACQWLWKYYHARGQNTRAGNVLVRLAHDPELGGTLIERLEVLGLAVDLVNEAIPRQTEVADNLSLLFTIATRVQVPIYNELRIISETAEVSQSKRDAAQAAIAELQQLKQLLELRRIAMEFHFYHILLVIADFSGEAGQQAVAAGLWLNVLMPPEVGSYSSQEKQPLFAKAAELFPLLACRPNMPFFLGFDASRPRPVSGIGGCPEILRLRLAAFLSEFLQMTSSSCLWDERCVATVMEYSNCLWLRSLEAAEEAEVAVDASTASSGAASSGGRCRMQDFRDDARAWVVIDVLMRQPFLFSWADAALFYGQMLLHLDSWLTDLQEILPRRVQQVNLTKDEMYVHLGAVYLFIMGRWMEGLGESPEKVQLLDFQTAWEQSVRLLLGDLDLRFNALAGSNSLARRLVTEAGRLDTLGRKLSSEGAAAAGFASIAPPMM